MREEYINQIGTLVGDVMETHNMLRSKFADLDQYRTSLGEAAAWGLDKIQFDWLVENLEKDERTFKDKMSPFFGELHDVNITDFEKLDEIVHELLETLEDLDQPVDYNYLNHLPKTLELTKPDNPEGYVLHFKGELKNEALKVLNENLDELNSKENEYINRYTTPENNQALNHLTRSLREFRELEDAISLKEAEWDQYSRGFMNMRSLSVEDAKRIGEEIKEKSAIYQQETELLEAAREDVLLNRPELGAFRNRYDGTESVEAIQVELQRGFGKAREAIADAARKVQNDDMPLEVLEPVIEKVKAKLGVLTEGQEGHDTYSKSVNDWLRSKRRTDNIIKIAGTVVSLGCAIALFCTGVGGAAAIAIGFAGAAAGGAVAVYNFERLNDLNAAAQGSRITSQKIVNDPEAIHREYVWAIADLILSGVDLAGAVFEVTKVMKLVNQFDDAAVGSRVVLQLDDLSEARVNNIAEFFNSLDELKQKELLDYLNRHKNLRERLEVIEEIGVDEIFNPVHGLTIEDRIMNITIRDLGDARMRNVEIIQRLDASQPSSQGIYRQENLVELRSFQDDVNMVLNREGISLDEFNRMRQLPVSKLSPGEAKLMKRIRELIPPPTNETLMQKVIHADDISGYFQGVNGGDPFSTVGGFVTEAADMKGISSYTDVRESLRLDYKLANGEIPYKPEMDSYGIIRFKTEHVNRLEPENIFSPMLGGSNEIPAPGTGHGFTSARNGNIIPEYSFPDDTYLDVLDGAELYRVDKNGTETLIGVYVFKEKKFIPVELFTSGVVQ